MKRDSDIRNNFDDVRKRAWQQRLAIITSTVIVLACCVVVVVKKSNTRAAERQRVEAARQAEREARLQREREEAIIMDRQRRLINLDLQRRQDSLAALTEAEPPKPTWSWNDIEEMVRNLTDEDYYASIWCEEYDTPRWVVIYSKGGRKYFRRFNAETKKYGPKVRLIKESDGRFHASGNKRDKYYYGGGSQLVHEVNGIEKERFYNHRSIDLFTPEPVPDGYEDWEDYYYDNVEDLYFYYGK